MARATIRPTSRELIGVATRRQRVARGMGAPRRHRSRPDKQDRRGDTTTLRSGVSCANDGHGATDGKYLRAVGFRAGGPASSEIERQRHGKDERVLIKSYYDSQEFLYRLVKEMSSSKPVP
jgi:hypothetical protein